MAIIKADPSKFLTRLYLGLVCFSIAGHYFSLILRQDPGFIAPVVSFLTLFTGLGACSFSFWKTGRHLAWTISAIVFIYGAATEIVGLTTGFPFGRYRYTDHWWPVLHLGSVGSFPLLLPFAWLMVAHASAFAGVVSSSRIANALMAATLATSLDLVMEGALAGKLDYWRWLEPGPFPGGAPMMNSVGWFGTSFVAASLLYSSKQKLPAKNSSVVVLAGQVVLMLCLQYP